MGGYRTCFYGIRISSIVESSTIGSIVKLILSKRYLKVLTFNRADWVCCVL